MVASAVSGEGRTLLASQLAVSWLPAVPGKVILVDADLRAPDVHHLFEINSGPGLAEVLRGECSLEESIINDSGDGLFVLPAGKFDAVSTSRLFAGPRFREILTQLRAQYDKIFIDAPPVLCASETLLIAKQSDAVLLSARHAYSRLGQVKEAYELLVASDVKVVATVLIGVPMRKYLYSLQRYAQT